MDAFFGAVKVFLHENRDAILTFATFAAIVALAIYFVILAIRLVAWVARQIAAAFEKLWMALRSVVTAIAAVVNVFQRPFLTKPALNLPPPASVNELFKATHVLYLATFVIGVIVSANTLVRYVAPIVRDNRQFIFPMLVFSVANCVHVSLIYRDLREAEDGHSKFFKRYDGWWIGIGIERALRVCTMVFLLALAGELPIEKMHLYQLLRITPPDTNRFVMTANCGLYFFVFLWNVAARFRVRRYAKYIANAESDDVNAPEKARAELGYSIFSDSLALLLWLGVSTLTRERQLFASVLAMAAVGYLINIVWYRPHVETKQSPHDRLVRMVWAFSILVVLIIMNFGDIDLAWRSSFAKVSM